MASIRWQVLPGLMTAIHRRIVEVLWRFHGGRPNLGPAGQVDQAWGALALFNGTRSEPGLEVAGPPLSSREKARRSSPSSVQTGTHGGNADSGQRQARSTMGRAVGISRRDWPIRCLRLARRRQAAPHTCFLLNRLNTEIGGEFMQEARRRSVFAGFPLVFRFTRHRTLLSVAAVRLSGHGSCAA